MSRQQPALCWPLRPPSPRRGSRVARNTKRLSHLGSRGEARMVDVVRKGDAKKGDVLGVARVAGIMAAKRTHELIPLCHPLPLSQVQVDAEPDEKLPGVRVTARVKVASQTGVEMEALAAVSIACLTIYDMVKAVERGMRIDGIRLIEKSGGRSGHYRAKNYGQDS